MKQFLIALLFIVGSAGSALGTEFLQKPQNLGPKNVQKGNGLPSSSRLVFCAPPPPPPKNEPDYKISHQAVGTSVAFVAIALELIWYFKSGRGDDDGVAFSDQLKGFITMAKPSDWKMLLAVAAQIGGGIAIGSIT